MKATIELDDKILWALSTIYADRCALAWWDGAAAPRCKEEVAKTLYEYAFHDGMEYLLSIIKNEN